MRMRRREVAKAEPKKKRIDPRNCAKRLGAAFGHNQMYYRARRATSADVWEGGEGTNHPAPSFFPSPPSLTLPPTTPILLPPTSPRQGRAYADGRAASDRFVPHVRSRGRAVGFWHIREAPRGARHSELVSSARVGRRLGGGEREWGSGSPRERGRRKETWGLMVRSLAPSSSDRQLTPGSARLRIRIFPPPVREGL
jgi:hypothetical protein